MTGSTTISRSIEDLENLGGLRDTDIANIADVPKATVSHWRTGASKPRPRNELILSDLHYLIRRLQEYYTSAEIRAWLYARHPQLDGERAIDLIHAGRRVEMLRALRRFDSDGYL
jgi:hypothetical protein